MTWRTKLLTLAAFGLPAMLTSGMASAQQSKDDDKTIRAAAAAAEQELHQTFTNLQFEDFGPSPVQGPIYQANVGGRIIYYAPKSAHLLFAAVYDKNGVNITALAQEEGAQHKLKLIDPAKALTLGPANAPTVIEFTDPECPYCQALERFWAAKAAEGKPVRRLIYFVPLHQDSSARAEHILCSPDREAAFKATYAGQVPAKLRTCPEGHDKVEHDSQLFGKVGITGTPTLIVEGKLISGFQQGELEAFLDAKAQHPATPVAGGQN